jgi:6-phosphogluconolactonase/glucosamine-6-phosphate isomerase/deaminase
MTIPCLNDSRRVVFLVTGESKREAVRRAFVDADPTSPAARVRPPEGEVLVLLDAAAAP